MILFFGPPGSGKSVQGQLLVKKNNWRWLSTGDLFRHSNDPEVLRFMATGELIDDHVTNKVLKDTLASMPDKVKIVLDGYPRNINQAKWLMTYAAECNREVNCVVLFDVPRVELIKRLTKRARAEDSIDIINKRLDIYESKTKPVKDFYRHHNVPIMVIDGVGPISEVHERIQTAVESCLEIE